VILVVIVELNSFAHFEDILEHASLDECGDCSGFESDLIRSKPVINAYYSGVNDK